VGNLQGPDSSWGMENPKSRAEATECKRRKTLVAFLEGQGGVYCEKSGRSRPKAWGVKESAKDLHERGLEGGTDWGKTVKK